MGSCALKEWVWKEEKEEEDVQAGESPISNLPSESWNIWLSHSGGGKIGWKSGTSKSSTARFYLKLMSSFPPQSCLIHFESFFL